MTTAAPQQLHECLDLLYQAVVVGRNMGFGTQVIICVDRDGNVGDLKVSMNGKAAGTKKPNS